MNTSALYFCILLFSIVQSHAFDTLQAHKNYKKAQLQYNSGQYQLAAQTYELAKQEFFKQKTLQRGVEMATYIYVSQLKFDITEAYSSLIKAKKLAKKYLGEGSLTYIEILLNEGTFYSKKSEFNQARKLHHKALKLHKKYLPDSITSVLISIYNGIGFYYLELDYYDSALVALKKCLKYSIKLNRHAKKTCIYYINIANAHLGLGEYEQAEVNAQKSMELAKQVGLNYHLSYSYHILAAVYDEIGDWYLAQHYLKKSKELFESLYGKESYEVVACLVNLGATFEKLGNYKAQIQHLKQANDLIIKNFPNHISNIEIT